MNTRLEHLILAAFEQACTEDHMGVAEHLLQALEAMDTQRPGETESRPVSRSVAQAYLLLAEERRPPAPRAPGRRCRSGRPVRTKH
jgi:hypothetical protein